MQVDWRTLESYSFGDGPKLADELLNLVLEGKKIATCWDATEGLKGAEVGKLWVAKTGAGQPRAVLETVELTQRRFDAVDAAFAHDEGEDNQTLDSWQAAHQRYFTRNGGFAPDMLLNCERFRLVELIGEGAER